MGKFSFKPGWVSQIFFYFGGFVIYTAWQSNRHGDGLDYLTAFLIAVPFFALGAWIANRDRRRAMEDLDELAAWTLENALQAANRGESLPTMLYLRPFELTNRMRFKNPRPPALMTPEYYSEESTLDLETIIAEEVMDSTPMIALGDPGEHVGAGRLFSTEEDWRQSVQAMAQAVKRILILPSANAGTKWELQWLLNTKYLDKCYFLIPPQPDRDDTDMTAYWTDTAQQLEEIGIELPPYNPEGQIYTVDADGRFDQGQSISLFQNGSIEKALRSLESGQAARAELDLKSASKRLADGTLSTDLSQSHIESKRSEREAPGNADGSPEGGTAKPRWRRARAVSYLWIAAAFIGVSIVLGLVKDDPEKIAREKVIQEYLPENLRGSITPEYLERLDRPVSDASSNLQRFTTTAGVSMLAPANWELQPLNDPQGLLIRPAAGSLRCIIYSEDFAGEEIDLNEFIAELNANTLANGLRDNLAAQLAGIPALIEVKALRYDAKIVDGTAMVDYLMEIVMSAKRGMSIRQVMFAEGKRMLRNKRFVYAQCDMDRQVHKKQGKLVRQMLESVEF